MTTTKERYRITAEVNIPAHLPVEEDSIPLPRQALPQDFLSGSFSVGIKQVGPKLTVFDVELVIELPFDEEYMQPKWQTTPGIHFETDSHLVGIAVDLQLGKLMRPLIVRLAHETRAPAFLSAFDYTPYPVLFPSIHVDVKHYSFDIKPTTGKTIGIHPPGRVLNNIQLLESFARETYVYDYFGAMSDMSYYKIDVFGSIVWLTTTLEVAAYHYLKAKLTSIIGSKADKFTPETHLGISYPTIASGVSLKQSDLVAYIGCEELWGTRHEIVHNGRIQVRCYDQNQGKANRNLTRPLENQDTHKFRAAVMNAITWMKSA